MIAPFALRRGISPAAAVAAVLALVAFVPGGLSPARAGIPEPDTVFFGSIALDGEFITAANTDVVVELRATPDGPPIRSYRMGDSPAAGNFYVVRAPNETVSPALGNSALPLGSVVHLVVRDASGVRDSKQETLTGRGRFVRVNFGDVDTDGDGMSDSFELQYFGSETAGDPFADPDNDGRPNFREFLQGTDPLTPDGRHPADLSPADDAITITEVTAYTLAWQLGEPWAIEPTVIPVEYVTRAGALWKGGEIYIFNNNPPTNAPMWWVNPPATPALADAAVEESENEDGGEPTGSSRAVRSASTASAGSKSLSATRSAESNFTPGQPLAVRVSATPDASTLSFAVEETPPEGWIVRNISHGGRYDRVNRKIKWGPFYDKEAREFTYEVTPLPGASQPGEFEGVASFNGRNLALAGRATVYPPGMSAPPALTLIETTATGEVRFEIRGAPNAAYIIEVSTDLREWQTLESVTANAEGAASGLATGNAARHAFFRVRANP
jgi:hypothetical protein